MPAHTKSAKCNPEIAVIGIDIGKNVFHLIGVDSCGAIVLKRKLSRSQLESFMTDVATKVRENRLRRIADRRGYRLSKSPRRDPNALDYGLFALLEHRTGGAVNAPLADHFVHSWDLDTVEAYLTNGKRK